MDSLMRPARRLRLAVVAGLVVVIALMALAATETLGGAHEGLAISFAETVDPPLAPWAQMTVIMLSGTPFAAGLWRLARMLRRIEQGSLFNSETIADLRGFALLVLVSALVSILLPPILAALQAARGTQLTLTFDGSDFFVLLIAALLFLLARLFGAAQRLADENSQII